MFGYAEANGTPLLSRPPRTDKLFINLVSYFRQRYMFVPASTNILYENGKKMK